MWSHAFCIDFITVGDFFEGHLIGRISKQLALVLRRESFCCIPDILFMFPAWLRVPVAALCCFRFKHVRVGLYFLVRVVSNSIREILILTGVLECCNNTNADVNNEVGG